MKAHPLKPEHALDFILGGHSTFTIKSLKTGTRYTFKVNAPKSNDKDTSKVFWVRMLTGNDNETDYTYIGFIKCTAGAWIFYPKVQITNGIHYLRIAFNEIISKRLHNENLEVWHEGKCCRCGRKLTVPESIESGIGPECIKIKSKKGAHHEHA